MSLRDTPRHENQLFSEQRSGELLSMTLKQDGTCGLNPEVLQQFALAGDDFVVCQDLDYLPLCE